MFPVCDLDRFLIHQVQYRANGPIRQGRSALTCGRLENVGRSAEPPALLSLDGDHGGVQ